MVRDWPSDLSPEGLKIGPRSQKREEDGVLLGLCDPSPGRGGQGLSSSHSQTLEEGGLACLEPQRFQGILRDWEKMKGVGEKIIT